MTEHRSASSIHLLRSSSSTSTTSGRQSSSTDTLSFVDKSFSHELSRATQRSSNTGATEHAHRDKSPERSVSKPREYAERSQRTHGHETIHSEGRSARPASTRADSSADESRVAATPSENESPSTEKTQHASLEAVAAQKSKEATGNDTSKDELIPKPDAESTVFAARQSEEQRAPVTTQQNLLPDSSTQVVQPSQVETASLTSTQVQAPMEETGAKGKAQDPTVTDLTDLTDQPGSAIDAEPDDATALNATPLNLANPLGERETAAPVRTAQRLTTGEHLSSSELASRQAHLTGTAASRERPSAGSMTPVIAGTPSDVDSQVKHAPLGSAVITEKPLELDAQVKAAPVGSARATLVSGEAGISVGARGADMTGYDPADTKPALPHAVAADERAESQSSGRLLQSDLQAAANVDQRVVAEKMEQQALAANLVQARQQAQQQSQNMAQLTGSPATELSDNSSQVPDNMFLSLPGGIVTAPVLQRADAGNTQTINAPVHMQILQNDADKAMASNVRWMVNEGVKNAVVNVTPGGMGPISVSIGIDKEQMSVSIIALQGSTREALESMLPRLKEQLAAQGHDSVKVDISDGRADHSDRGYGQQFSRDQHSSEPDSGASATRVVQGESDSRVSEEKNKATLPTQGLLVVNNDGQIKSSYDVYV